MLTLQKYRRKQGTITDILPHILEMKTRMLKFITFKPMRTIYFRKVLTLFYIFKIMNENIFNPMFNFCSNTWYVYRNFKVNYKI